MTQSWDPGERSSALAAMSCVLESFGRSFVFFDRDFRVVHAAASLQCSVGQAASALFGEELFGVEGVLRQALERGERREEWRVSVPFGGAATTFVSLSVAPLPRRIGDLRAAYLATFLVDDFADDFVDGDAPTLFCGMLGRSAVMTQLFDRVRRLHVDDAPVLLTAGRGNGKTLLARAIHRHSSRRDKEFVTVQVAAMPAALLESELFGHVRGAFTGAVRDRVGRIELAHGGTIYLPDIGEMPRPLQTKLVRFLRERTFARAGESVVRSADVRVIAATSADRLDAIDEELFACLRGIQLEIPPLRERRDDVAPLAQFLLARVAARHGRALHLLPDAMRALLEHPWPGNVRELESALEYAVAVARAETIELGDLPAELFPRERVPSRLPVPRDERELLMTTLDAHHWRRDDAARALGISRTTLWRRMREARLID
ncbi:MAG TPA: sigma-54 dependent transcriptional regulator [Thermoanaerobaculia bacterium]|nr:sigma-54 dependent transcriptional regulator [Thermoanaerobaculia bacterium]